MSPLRITTILLTFALAFAANASSFDVTLARGTSPTTYHGEATITTMTFAWSHRLSPRWEDGIAFMPTIVDQPRSWFGQRYGDGNETVRAGEIAIFARRTFATRWHDAQPYFTIATGPMWAQKRVPAATSRFNIGTALETGLVLFPGRALPLVIGARFTHVSNAGYSRRNPGLEITSLVFGTRLSRH